MDKFIKRLQTRASRKGVSVSKSQVREVYESVVASPESPTDEEISAVIEQLESQYKAPLFEPTTDLATIEESAPIQQQKPEKMTTAQPSSSTLATSNSSTLSHGSTANLSITQQQIQEAVEQQFGRENLETKTAILNYVAQDTFNTAQELQMALSKLRQMRLDILMKLIADHNSRASSDEDLLKNALRTATANRQRETEDFFGSFENQLLEMRAAFGV
jgi:DNA-binding protein Fis/plasmid stability protein